MSSFESNDDEDVTQYLPVLKRETPPKNPAVEELEVESSWFEAFTNDVKDDVDPRKLDELIVDHLICSGHRHVAWLLCADANIPFPPTADDVNASALRQLDTLEQRDAIRNAVVAGDMACAFTLVNELAPDLLKIDERLHFNMLRQQIVELIRKKDIDRVLSFAQDNVMDKCQQPPEQFARLEQTFALLAFDRPEESPFGYLMSVDQRNILACELNEAILAHLKLSTSSKLENLLRILVFNHNQVITKGEPLSPDAQFGRDKAYRIAREIFSAPGDGSYYDSAL